MQCLLLFDDNNNYANAPQGYVVPKLPHFHVVHSVRCKSVNKPLQCQQMYNSTITYFTLINFLHASVNPWVTNDIYIYIYIYVYIYICIYMECIFLMFLDRTQRRTTVGRTPLDERSARPEESYRLCCCVVCDLETSRICTPYIYIYIYIYTYIFIYDISTLRVNDLTLILLTWRKWWANNASK
jgi:hypothetical protein